MRQVMKATPFLHTHTHAHRESSEETTVAEPCMNHAYLISVKPNRHKLAEVTRVR